MNRIRAETSKDGIRRYVERTDLLSLTDEQAKKVLDVFYVPCHVYLTISSHFVLADSLPRLSTPSSVDCIE